MITYQEVKTLFDYKDGELHWKISRSNAIKVGDIAGNINKSSGYRLINVDHKPQRAHRLVWLWHYGQYPEAGIDHINGNRNDNRIENLRAANQSQNLQNKAVSKNNTSGVTGVSYCNSRQKWAAYIKINYKRKWLGYHSTKDQAQIAYAIAKQQYHTFHSQEVTR